MPILGYMRAAAGDPSSVLEEQLRLLATGPYPPARTFGDDGGSDGQPQLQACLAVLTNGDLLVITRADRLTGDVDTFLRMECELHNRGVGVVVLSFGGVLVDFRTPEGEATLKVLTEVTNWQYDAFRERQVGGIAAAKAAGRYRGRRASIPAEDVRKALQGGGRPAAVAREMGIARSSVYRIRDGQAAGVSG